MIKRLATRLFLVPAIAGLSIGLLACSSDKTDATASPAAPSSQSTPAAASSPTAGATARPSASPTAQGSTNRPPASQVPNPTEPSGARILEDVRYLSQGPRSSGTDLEKAAAEYVADKLTKAGYEVSIQEFNVQVEARSSSVQVKGGNKPLSIPLSGSGGGAVSAQVVAAGIGRPEEFPANVSGNIALIQRGELTFTDKVNNAQAAGAAGVIIYNNERDVFNGQLSINARIPVIAISQAEGAAITSALDKGRVDAEVSVGDNGRATSRNVIAKPPGKDCETVTGGHMDSVPVAPGASDNASGTATVVEIASVIAGKGEMGSNCFVLFGSEELGLLGSKHFVDQLDTAAKNRIKAMFNYDMVGVGTDGWLFIGDTNLQRTAQRVGGPLGISGATGQLRGASSDYASFLQAGIPAFMLFRQTDSLLHTPKDVIDRVNPDLLEQAAKLGIALIETVNSGG